MNWEDVSLGILWRSKLGSSFIRVSNHTAINTKKAIIINLEDRPKVKINFESYGPTLATGLV